MRRSFVLGVCLLLLGSSLALTTLIQADMTFQLRGVEYPLADRQLPARIPRLGVNADLLQYTPPRLRTQLDAMQAMGVTWIRQIVDWSLVEPQPGLRDWSAWDETFQTLRAYPDLQIIPVFFRSPAWAVSLQSPYSVTLPPDDPADLASFAADFAGRYGTEVRFYQVWDEPNLYDAWGQTNPIPAQYLALLTATYQAVHAVDADAVILSAALAPTTEDNARNISDWHYLEQLYRLGLADVSDAVAAKSYGFDASPQDRSARADTLNFSRFVRLREIMLEWHDEATALWLSEGGWNTLPVGWLGEASIWGQVSAAQQADYTLAAFNRIEREMPYIGGAILADWQPATRQDDPRWGFSLRTPADKPTTLYTALSQLPHESLPSNGYYPAVNDAAQYSGVWSFGALGADIGWLETTDSQLTFDFSGRDIGLRLREGDYIAFLYPTVDEQPANATQQDSSGHSYVLLRSDSEQPELNTVALAHTLTATHHRLRLVADKGWDQWALAGFVVSDGNPALPYQQLLAIGQIAIAVSGLAVLMAASTVRNAWLFPLQSLWRLFTLYLAGWTLSLLASLALTIGMLLSFGDGIPQIWRRDALVQVTAVLISGGLLAFEWPFIIVILACLVLFLIFYHRPIMGISLTLLYAPFFLFPVELYRFSFPVSELILLLTAAAALLRGSVVAGRHWQTHVSQFRWRGLVGWQMLDSAALIYAGLGLIALVVSSDRARALTELRTLIIEPIVFYGLIRSCVPREQLHLLIRALLMGGFLVCVVGLFLYARGEAIITAEEGARRLSSVYGSPNNVALLLERCLPFALASLWYHRQRRSKLLYAALALVLLVTVLLTQSTGGLLLGIPVSLAVMGVLVFRRRAFLLLTGLSVLLVGVAASLAQVSARFSRVLDFTEGTNFIRLRVWESAISLLREHPLTGIGLDQFLELYRGTYVRPDAIWDSQLNHPHNVILDVWLRLGLAGLIWFISVQVIFWRTGISLFRSASESFQPLLLGAMGAMAAVLAHGLVDNSLFVVDMALIFWLLLALIAQIAADKN